MLSLEVSSESDNIYPPVVCNSCYLTLKEIQKAKERGEVRSTNLKLKSWLPHSEDCEVCLTVSGGGKPKRRKVALEVKGRPSKDNMNRSIMTRVAEIDPPQFVNFQLQPSYFLPNSMLNDLLCLSCSCIPNQPLEIATCRHYICVPCIVSSCESGSSLLCNCNGRSILPHHLCIPSPVVMKVFSSLLVRCKNDCGEVMQLKDLKLHITSNCTHIEIPSPSKITVNHLLHTSDIPTQSRMEKQAIGLLVDKLMPTNGFISCRSASGKVRH